jgi:hypothetical protein
MNNIPIGNFKAKLELEDDSFELTQVEIRQDGSFACESSRLISGAKFRMVFVDNQHAYREFDCSVDSKEDYLVTGKLSNLKFS